MRFSAADRELLNALILDPSAQPRFDLVKYCLMWPDERPQGISFEGHDLLIDLWIVRGRLHRGVPVPLWGNDPAYYQDLWERALEDVPRWPGFQRLELTKSDREFLETCLAKDKQGHDY